MEVPLGCCWALESDILGFGTLSFKGEFGK
jgi:hypothetical protein